MIVHHLMIYVTPKYETSFNKNYSIDILIQIEINFLFLIILNIFKKGLVIA